MDQFFEMVLTKNVKIIVDLLALGSMYDPDVAYIDLNEVKSVCLSIYLPN